MHKDFDQWNTVKKVVNSQIVSDTFYYYAREVWWCSIGVNVDVETDGKHGNFERPVLVIRKFNKQMFWGVPLTTRPHTGPFYHKVIHEDGVAWAMLSQLKTFSSKRMLRKVGMITEGDFARIQKKLLSLTIEPPHGGGGSRRPKPLID